MERGAAVSTTVVPFRARARVREQGSLLVPKEIFVEWITPVPFPIEIMQTEHSVTCSPPTPRHQGPLFSFL